MQSDVFIEQLVGKKNDLLFYLARTGIVAGGFALTAACFLIPAVSAYSPGVAFACLWLGRSLFRRTGIEFEYSVTNGELDIDVITGKSSRKRLISADARDFEILAPAAEQNLAEFSSVTRRLDASSSKAAPSRWFCVFRYKDEGRMLLVFEPDDRILGSLRMFARGRMRES